MIYLIYDLETEPDRARILRTEGLPGETLEQAYQRVNDRSCRPDQLPTNNQCFIPARFHVPRVLGILAVDQQGRYLNGATFAHATDWQQLVGQFWSIYNQTPGRVLVTFNGSKFDNVVMSVCALELRMQLPNWFAPVGTPVYKDPRSKNNDVSLDLRDWLTNGSEDRSGTLDSWARMLGLPGKGDIHGDSVTSMIQARQLPVVADYCAGDVANTYGMLMHYLHATGAISEPALGPTFLDTIDRFLVGRQGDAARFLASAHNSVQSAGLF